MQLTEQIIDNYVNDLKSVSQWMSFSFFFFCMPFIFIVIKKYLYFWNIIYNCFLDIRIGNIKFWYESYTSWPFSFSPAATHQLKNKWYSKEAYMILINVSFMLYCTQPVNQNEFCYFLFCLLCDILCRFLMFNCIVILT